MMRRLSTDVVTITTIWHNIAWLWYSMKYLQRKVITTGCKIWHGASRWGTQSNKLCFGCNIMNGTSSQFWFKERLLQGSRDHPENGHSVHIRGAS
mmetsp:Transcript_14215/g.19758  ORF Transcript_14215/g.19758 Transcript_14215/m.19758 type:complete len:95 (-) Transcript_14215:232-516(-)